MLAAHENSWDGVGDDVPGHVGERRNGVDHENCTDVSGGSRRLLASAAAQAALLAVCVQERHDRVAQPDAGPRHQADLAGRRVGQAGERDAGEQFGVDDRRRAVAEGRPSRTMRS
jgi:hypothetical protein